MGEEEVRYLRVPGKQEGVVILLLTIVLSLIMFFFITNEIILGLVLVACFVFLLWVLKKVQSKSPRNLRVMTSID